MSMEDAGKPWLIIITGAPGAGKTTLGKQVAQVLGLPFVHKDAIKETLFETLGWHDRAWSRRLGVASYALLFYFVEVLLRAGGSLIVESNFTPEWDTPRFADLQQRYGFNALQIMLTATPEITIARFRTRVESGERHPGHVDHQTYVEVMNRLRDCPWTSLALDGKVIEVDTTDFSSVDYAGLLHEIARIVEGVSDGA